jgi:outer membrane protein TolC
LTSARPSPSLSSIVELTQAQLNLTQVQIEQVNATYDYQTQLSVLSYEAGKLR